MVKKLVAGLAIGLSLTLASTAANALSFTTTGTTAGFLPGDFNLTPDVLGVNALDPALFANAVGSGLGVDGPANIKFTYLGNDAGLGKGIRSFDSQDIGRNVNAPAVPICTAAPVLVLIV